MTERLPDDGEQPWSAILGARDVPGGYLRVAHNDDGTLKTHAASHESGGSDAIKLDELAAPTDVTTLDASTSQHGLLRKLSGAVTEFLNGNGGWTTPTVAEGGLSLTDVSTANASTSLHGLLRKLDANGGHFLDGNGAWSNIDEAALTLTDITTADSSTSQHGLLPKLDGNTAHFLNGNGGWTTPAGGGGYAGPEIFAAGYGVSAGSSAASNATNLQAALDDANGLPVVLPSGTINFDTTLTLSAEAILLGTGVNGGGTTAGVTILNYTGADATNGVEMSANDLNGVWIEGIRFIDGRTTPTSGDMVHLAGVKNGSLIRRCTLHSLSGHGLYIGGASNHTSEGPHVTDCWAYGKTYAIMLEYIDNWFELANIWVDTGTLTQCTAAIYLGTMVQSSTNGVVRNAKLEVNSGAHLLQIDAACLASVVAGPLTMIGKTPTAGEGGDVVHTAAVGGSLVLMGISSMQAAGSSVADNLVNDVANGVTYGAGKRGPISFMVLQGFNQPSHVIMAGQRVRTQGVSASTTLDNTHYSVAVTAGGTNRTITLPAASASFGQEYVITKIDTGVGTVIIDPNSSELINRRSTVTLPARGDSVTIQCDGTAWNIVSGFGSPTIPSVSVNPLTGSSSDADQSSYTTASISPTAGRVWLAWIVSTRGSSTNPPVPGITGAGLTWTPHTTLDWATDATTRRKIDLYVGTGTPSAGALTIDYSGTTVTSSAWAIWELIGANVTTPLVQVVTAFDNTTLTTATATLAAAASSRNRPAGMFAHGTGEGTTPRANWTEVNDIQPAGPAGGYETQYRADAFETTCTATFATGSKWGVMVAELAEE